jgi:type III restriction enzyme
VDGEFVTSSPVAALDSDLLAEIDGMLDLRTPNRDAVETLAYELWSHYQQQGHEHPFEGVIDSATGVGKTFVIVAAVEYLARARGVRDFVVVAPSRVVLDKTIEQFTPGGPRSIVDRLSVPIELVTADNFNTPATAARMNDADVVKVYAFSVQSLVRPESVQGRRTHRFQEGLGAGFYVRLQQATPLVVFADEHHLYYGPRFSQAVRDLSPWALVGLTATPHKKTPSEQVIYRYPLAAAIAQRYVKTPVIVGRKDDKHDLTTKLLDGLVLLDHKRSVASEWANRRQLPQVNPVMLVVARDTTEADAIAAIVRSDDFRDGRYRDAVLVVHSNVKEAEEPAALAQLAAVEHPGSPIRVVVSVAMLKEGWDVKNVYVLLSTQPSVSAILTEQVLGRGLRLPWNSYQGVEMLDTLEVLAHERYEDLLARRGLLAEQFVDYITRARLRRDATGREVVVRETEEITTGLNDRATTTEASPGHDGDGPFDAVATPTLEIAQPGAAVEPAPVPTVTSTEDRIGVSGTEVTLVDQVLAPARVLAIPRVRVMPKPATFRLSDVHDDEPFRALGRRLRADPQRELRRVLIGAKVVTDPATGLKSVRTITTTATDIVHAQGSLIPAAELRGQLADTLLRLPVLSARTDDGTQARAAARIVDAFMDGLNGGADELLAAYLERAGARLAQIVVGEYKKTHLSQPSYDPRVDLIDFGPERTNTRPVNPDPRGLPVRGQAFDGWTRGLYALAWFDSSTERDFALVADSSDQVDKWVRLHRGDLPIVYTEAGQKYEPDFVVVETSGQNLLVEVKADRDLDNVDVRAKKAAAQRWTAYVNDGLAEGPHWSYLLVSETDLRQAKEDWAALKELCR